ncbi:MAG: hypothetical protein PVH88_01805 [Ignavibacteria bacterium]
MSIEIRKVTNNSELNNFLKFPWAVYKEDSYWVPPLLMDIKKKVNKKKNPFFEHGDMDSFLAYKDGKIAGRISAISNDLHNEVHNENIGFFGFFECNNDQEVANKLFDTAKEWCAAKGFDAIRGPVNPSTNDDWALLVDGFEDSPRLMMPYNPKYYIDLLENYGFEKAKDLHAWKITEKEMRKEPKIERVAEIAKKRSGLKIREVNMKDFENELNKVKYIYNKAWEPNWGFVPFTDKEIDDAAASLKPLVESDLVLFGEINGETIGFALVMLDFNYIFKQMNGKLFPFNIIKLFTKRKEIPWARIIILGIVPEFQKRGLDAAFYWEIINRAAKRGIYQGEASWVLEDNEAMIKGARTMRGIPYKTYRAYEYKLK